MGVEEFLHYNDGSMAAFTKGVVMDLGTAFDKIPGFSLICE